MTELTSTKTRLTTLSILTALLIPMLVLIQKPASAADLVVLAKPEAPFKFEESGQPQGIDIEVIDAVFDKLGISYKVEFIRSDARIQEDARNGRADMLLVFSKNAKRQEYLTYPEESYVDIGWNFFIRSEDQDKIVYESFDDLKDLKIGITKDISYTPEFLASGLSFEESPRSELQIGKLLAKRFDAVPMNTISTLYEQNKEGNLDKIAYLPKPLKSKAYYNVFTKASKYPGIEGLPAKYDAAVRELKADGTIDAIFAKYLGN
ncbi:substrate-binding periplasmic protein [Roseibium sp.]|uniref:substrate-binding periplasmic protein n=1 Tax=Roseibium sp. TaxID=1936156 RepID=UPI003D09EE89